MYRLLIADDEPLVQAGVRSMLDWSKKDIEVCGTALNGQAALQIIEEMHPEIVITDIKMPIMDGLELTRICRERWGNDAPYIIMLTSYEDFQLAREALTYHVFDYLVKIELTPEKLGETIDRVLEQLRKRDAARQTPAVSIHPFYDKFFISLLHDLFESEEQFRLQSQDLNLDFHYAGYVCCYGEIVSASSEAMQSRQQVSLFTSSLQMIREIGGKYMPMYVTSLDLRHYALICCYEALPEGDVPYDLRLREILTSISTTLHNYYNAHLRCGIGSLVQTPAGISDSYQHARQAYVIRTDDLPIPTYDQDIRQDTRRSAFNISLFRGDLTRAFEEYDAEVLQETIRSISDLFASHPDHYLQAFDAASNILYLSISLLQDGEQTVAAFYADDPDSYCSLYKQSNTEQVLSWLQDFTDHLTALFNERRRDYKNHIVTNVRRYIAEHVNEHLSLNEVAAVFSISPGYLSQLFSRYNETGFSEYVSTCKITEAKRLLDEEHLKVYEVADRLGYESAFYFSKVFKRVEGISPTDYINRG